MQYVLPVQQTTSSSAEREELGNVDDARISGPKTPPVFWCEVIFGKSIFYPWN